MAHYRTIFISDVHLGTRNCQAHLLLEFLNENDADTYYLVGDIVDFWRIKRGAVWPESHNEVLQKLLQKSRLGAEMIFIPGNHDEGLRAYCGTRFGNIQIVRDAIFKTAKGKRYLVTHGDEFDVVMKKARRLWMQTTQKIHEKVSAGFPVDVIVRNPDFLRERLLEGDTFLEEITSKGRVMHEGGHS